jgi:predicted TPR repeat methyltransferase
MRPLTHTSGDLVVDRRAGFADALARSQDFAGAAEVMADAVGLAPHWTAGWQLLGDYRSQAGDVAGAAEAYARVASLDTHAIFGSALTLAAHGAGAMPAGTDVGYVETLFDEYAVRFEHELVVDLGYSVPPVLGRMVADALAGRRAVRSVDLGCGTGLMGVELRAHCIILEGVDLSARMLTEARAKGLYDRLERAELVEFLRTDPGGFDLLTAADTLIYCGALPPILASAHSALAPGGLFGFSLELHDGSGTLLQRRSLRYAHNAEGAVADCVAAGFEIVTAKRMAIRRERDQPVDGLIILVRKPADQAAVK